MSNKEPITKKNLAKLGYSKEQIDMLLDLTKRYENSCEFQGFVTSLPAKYPISTDEKLKDN